MLAAVGSATPLLVQLSGTWGATAPVSTWSAPNESWSWSFTIDSNPTPTFYVTGVEFVAPITSFTYVLNGSAVATQPSSVLWITGGLGGMFEVGFSGNAMFALSDVQAYTGPESAPTIIPGAYVLNSSQSQAEVGEYDQLISGTVTITPEDLNAPEPAALALALMGAAALAGLRRRRIA